MGSVVLRVLRWLDALAQLLVPARDDRVAWISDPDYIGNAHHLYRHVVSTRDAVEHVWLITDPSLRERIEADFVRFGGPTRQHRLQVLDRHSLRGYLAFLRCRRVFHTHGVYRWTTTAVRRQCVSLWHGMPIKAIGALNRRSPNPHPTFGTLHVATSHFFRYVIAAAFGARDDEVLLTGLPRCDVLYRPHPAAPDAEQVREALGVDRDRHLVLWLPTYRTPGHRQWANDGVVGFQTFLDDLTDAQWDMVEREARRTGTEVLVKPHPHDPLNESGHRLSHEHVRLITAQEWTDLELELYDVLAVTDGLISDLSSVLIDWLPTGRPLGMAGFDPETYTRDVLFPVETLHRSARVHDLSDPSVITAFFDAVASGRRSPLDDTVTWLYPPDLTDGCETVLDAVGM